MNLTKISGSSPGGMYVTLLSPGDVHTLWHGGSGTVISISSSNSHGSLLFCGCLDLNSARADNDGPRFAIALALKLGQGTVGSGISISMSISNSHSSSSSAGQAAGGFSFFVTFTSIFGAGPNLMAPLPFKTGHGTLGIGTSIEMSMSNSHASSSDVSQFDGLGRCVIFTTLLSVGGQS